MRDYFDIKRRYYVCQSEVNDTKQNRQKPICSSYPQF